MDQLIGKTLNRYAIFSLLGQGGIGAVYRARDTVLQRDVAIKVLSPEYAGRPNFQERFLQEARAAARLDHPNIVRVHDFGRASLRGQEAEEAQGEDHGFLYIVMEYIPGDNLRKLLNDLRAARQWVILPEAVGIVTQVAGALEYAHQQGVIHLDIKPSNLMLKPAAASRSDNPNELPYQVLITDLGLARLVGEENTAADGSMGTPSYMSPEQALGQPTDARSDVYSLGVLLYELSVGRVPFQARTIEEARSFASQPAPSPRSIRPDLPAALEQVILQALQKDPAQRYASAGELARALLDIQPAIREVAFHQEEITQTISLLIPYENTVADESLPPDRQAAAGRNAGDSIEILLPDQSVRIVRMKPDGMIIGRGADNDIVLDNPKVSRHHTRIQWDGSSYWASDLNSKNGTFLVNHRLIPGELEKWTPEKTLQIGDFKLSLHQTTPESVIPAGRPVVAADQAATLASDEPIRSGSNASRVGLWVEAAQLPVIPGNSVTARLVVVNQASVTDQFRITVAGIPANWIPNPPPVIRLAPGERQEVDIPIHPPLSPRTRPGRYPLTIRAYGLQAPDLPAEVEATMTVGVYTQFTSQLQPHQIWAGNPIRLTVTNGGNARQAFTITPSDPLDEVAFDPPQAQVALSEGETATPEFVANPLRPRLFGGTRTYPFSVQVATSGGETQAHNGEVFTNGIVPLWVLPVALVICLCATALAAYGYVEFLLGPERARQTALAGTQAAYMTQTATIAIASQGTPAALTATAVWNGLDSDGDGLSNAEELRLGTNPDNPDSDGDTLPDGFEMLQLKCTSPLKKDTDDDGLPDNLDPDPCHASTATFTVTPITPSPAPPTSTSSPIVITATSLPPAATLTPPPPTLTSPPPTSTPTVTQAPVPQATATPLGNSYLVIFSSNRDGNNEIYAMLNDGTRQTRVTNNPANDRQPDLSANGLRTVFVSNRDGNDEIYVMNVDGGDQKRLTNNPASDTSPAWSPDGAPGGERIAFVSDRDGNKEIYVMNVDGTGQTRLTNNNVDDDHPTWSPDGTHIAFDSAASQGRTINVMNADGSGITPLVANGATNQDPDYSPDGGRIVYASNLSGSLEIFMMTADGSGQVQLTNLGLNASAPNWSRDELWLVFNTGQSPNRQVYRVDANGGNALNLTNNHVDNANPSW